jgi:hypothetical protein
MTTTTTDINALKSRLKATWMDGNYDQFSRLMESTRRCLRAGHLSPASTSFSTSM